MRRRPPCLLVLNPEPLRLRVLSERGLHRAKSCCRHHRVLLANGTVLTGCVSLRSRARHRIRPLHSGPDAQNWLLAAAMC